MEDTTGIDIWQALDHWGHMIWQVRVGSYIYDLEIGRRIGQWDFDMVITWAAAAADPDAAMRVTD